MNLPNFNFKKRLASATLGLALLAGSTLATTGIVPVKIAGVESQQSAKAEDPIIASGSSGCAYFKMQQAWWGQYTYLNKCATLQLADQYGITIALIGAANAKVPGWYKLAFAAGNIYNGSLRTNLYHCAANNGQSFVRLYRVGNFMAPYVSCD
jgi:hypothetical protein